MAHRNVVGNARHFALLAVAGGLLERPHFLDTGIFDSSTREQAVAPQRIAEAVLQFGGATA